MSEDQQAAGAPAPASAPPPTPTAATGSNEEAASPSVEAVVSTGSTNVAVAATTSSLTPSLSAADLAVLDSKPTAAAAAQQPAVASALASLPKSLSAADLAVLGSKPAAAQQPAAALASLPQSLSAADLAVLDSTPAASTPNVVDEMVPAEEERGVEVDENGSIKTESSSETQESASSSSSSGSGSGSSSSSTSSDPSIVPEDDDEFDQESNHLLSNKEPKTPPPHLRKSPPESLTAKSLPFSSLLPGQASAPGTPIGNQMVRLSSVKSSDSEDYAVLRADQLGDTYRDANGNKYTETEDEAARAAEEGEAFYNAYGDARTRLVGKGMPLSDDDDYDYDEQAAAPSKRRGSASASRRGSRQVERRGSKMGEDRANVRTMVAQRIKGKRYKRGSNNGGSSSARRGSRSGSGRHPASSSGAPGDPRAIDIDEPTGWSNPKKRRICYALLAVAIGIVGITLIVYGVEQNRAYESAKDDDYFYNDDNFQEDDQYDYGDGGASANDEEYYANENNANGSQPNEPAPAPPIPAFPNNDNAPPYPTIPSSTSIGGIFTAQPVTPSPVFHELDDALLTMLKQSYIRALDTDPTKETEEIVLLQTSLDSLDREIQDENPTKSMQYRVYEMMVYRNDIIDTSTNDLLMEDDRILQIYALTVFYETFGWPRDGFNECAWPGVNCRSFGVHATNPNPDPDDLRVVALHVKGEDGPRQVGEDGPFGPLLEGELPLELMFLRHLEALDVSHNLIGGELKGEMFQYKNMKVLELNDNRLEGDIPSEIGTMKFLQKLTLHHNEFTGEVPSALCDLRSNTLHFLWVDCSPMPSTNVPKVSCPIDGCCSICFEAYDEDGGPGTGGSSPPAGSKNDTPHSVQNDSSSGLKNMLSNASGDKGAALLDISSPQFHAYSWLVEDNVKKTNTGGNYEPERLFQRYALATLSFATNGAHWANSENWLTELDECDWFGISGCENADEEKIVSIELKENRLDGIIPSELLGFLPHIAILNLATNSLHGQIPTEIGALADVSILELAENQLTGMIPTQLGELSSVNHMFLQSNNFSGGQSMPQEVCDLRNAANGKLTLLWVDCRGDQGVSVQCANTCCSTCFTGGASQNTAGNNVFVGESNEALTHADTSKTVLGTLKKMAPDDGKYLDDSLSPQFKAYSWLVGSDKSSYETLNDVLLLQRYALAVLYFATAGHGWPYQEYWLSNRDVCEWDGVDDCNGGQMVTELDLKSNNLVGRIPNEITHLRLVEILDLTDNELYGPIPTQFGWFEDIEILRLGGNLLTGEIPTELAELSTLHELYLHVNEFTSTSIPEGVCLLRTQDGNGLSTVWADCEERDGSTLVYCETSCCDRCFNDDSDFEFYGGYDDDTYAPTPNPTDPQIVVPGRSFPPTPAPAAPTTEPLAENEGLKSYLVSHVTGFEERLSDPSSDAYTAYLWLANKRGYDELDEFRKLQRFGLATFYYATTPELDWKVSNGWVTDQHECDWFGVSCAVEDTVTEISLPGNRLSGTIPPEMALAALGGKIANLNLAGNNLKGELPEQLGTLTHLLKLDLSGNDFIEKIPASLGSLSILESLRLGNNNLTGDMPSEVCLLRADGALAELEADCDPEDPYDNVKCDLGPCCTKCD